MKCDHCPRDDECRGEEIHRFCELIDPDHPDHEPAYLDALGPTPAEPPPRDDQPPEHGCCPPPIP